MAKRFLVPIGLMNMSTDPADGFEGQVYFNTTIDAIKIYVNGAWTEMQSGGGGSVIYTPEQPDTTELALGTIWVDSNAEVTGGGGGGGGGPSFRTISTSPSSQVITALTTTEDLKFVSGENISISANDTNNTVTINSTGTYTSVDSISYPDYIVFDTTPENTSASVGTLAWDSGESSLSVQLDSELNVGIGQEIIILANNGEANTLNKGEVVRLSGASGQRPQVTRAYNLNDTGSALTIGIVAENISAGGEGFVVTQGIIKNINTNAFNEGDILYLSASAGVLSTVKPQAPNHYVFVGVVLKKNAASGRIYVKPQNGYELDELHDVRITSIQNDDLIVYNSASSLWVNSPKQDIINTASAAAVNYLVDGAPGALDTLNELAAALDDNADILDLYLTQSSASSTYATKITRWRKTYSFSGNESFTVTNNGTGAYVVAGVENPTFNLVKGNTYTFVINATGHPFWIQTVFGAYSSGDVYSTGTTNLGTASGTITWTVPTNAPDTLYYVCQYHSSMKGTINLIDPLKIQGVDDNSNTLSYNPGYELLHINGILLATNEYTTNSGSLITLNEAVSTNDVVDIVIGG
jgi:hypothetical protein